MTPESLKPTLETREGKQKRTILVVDDDRRVVDLLQISLSQNGYHVMTAGTGEEALEAVRRETPDLVILDLRLPKKNGYEVCAALKSAKETAAIPVIMVSATAEVDARLQGLMHGADDYLTKPFSPKELLIKVRRIFERMEKTEVLSTKNRELETEVARNREDLVVRNKELRFQVFSLETLMGLTHQLNSSLDLDSLMGTVILSVVGQLRVNSACLFLTDSRENPKRLDASTFKGVKEDLVRSISFRYDDDFAQAIRPVDGEDADHRRLELSGHVVSPCPRDRATKFLNQPIASRRRRTCRRTRMPSPSALAMVNRAPIVRARSRMPARRSRLCPTPTSTRASTGLAERTPSAACSCLSSVTLPNISGSRSPMRVSLEWFHRGPKTLRSSRKQNQRLRPRRSSNNLGTTFPAGL